MRIILLTTVLAALASPAMAQDWSGAPLVPPTLGTSAGVPLTLDNGGTSYVGGQVQPLAYNCTNPGGPPFFGIYFTPQPCTGGQAPYFSAAIGTPQNPNTAFSVTSLPAGAGAPGSQVGIFVQGDYPDPAAPAGVSYFTGYVPLSAFVNAAQSMSALSTRLDNFIATQQAINANQQLINANQQKVNANVSLALARLGRGVAMATSLALEGPIDGKSNHLSIGVGAYGDANAVSLNYAHRSGPVDVGVAVSYAAGDTLGKAQVGFSW